MTSFERLHRIQVHILYFLRHNKAGRFSELMRFTGMTSDAFKHHTKKLISIGVVQKRDDGSYVLTPSGKEYANRLDEITRAELLQPKTSTLMYVTSSRGGEKQYLMHRRKREPFYGFWGIASAPLKYGVSIFDSSSEEFQKQTGLAAKFGFHGSLRVIDTTPTGAVLEDKLFSILTAHIDDCPEFSPWHGGDFEWIDKPTALAKTPVFPATEHVITMIEGDVQFDELTLVYQENEY